MTTVKPTVDLSDHPGNCFVLLTRAKRAMGQAGMGQDIAVMEAQLGRLVAIVLRTGTAELPPSVFRAVCEVVARWCDIRD